MRVAGKLLGRLRAARERDPALFRLRVALGVGLLVLAILVVGGDPGDGVARRLAEGKGIRPIDYWRTQGWWAALVNLFLLSAIFASARLWFVRGPVPETPRLAPPPAPGRAFRWLVAGAVLACALSAAPRLDQSFWDDEEFNVENSIDGRYERTADGVRFREAKLRDVLWYYASPNNHVPHTILARLSLHTWRLLARPETLFAPEPVVRLPAFLAGLAAVASAALLCWRLGFERAGVLAAWLLALHPWHVKYTSEARGYSLVLLAMTVMPWLWIRVLHRPSWRRFAAFGVAQFLLLWNNSAQVFHLLLLNGALALSLLALVRRPSEWAPLLVRQAAVGVLGAMAWVQLMIPNLMQAGVYMDETRGVRDLGAWWLRHVGSHLFAGMPFSHRGRAPGAEHPELLDALVAHPAAVWAIGLLAGLALVWGVGRLLARRGPWAWLAVVWVATPPLTWAAAVYQQANAYVWYMVFVVPLLAVLVALGFEGLVAAAARVRAAPLALLGVAVWLCGFLWLTERPRATLRAESWKPGRESVLLTRPTLDPNDPANRDVMTVTFCSEVLYYDPLVHELREPDELQPLLDEADRRGVPLYVNAGRLYRMEKYWKPLLAMLEDQSLFEPVATLPGFEPPWSRRVWRYKGRAYAAGARPGAV